MFDETGMNQEYAYMVMSRCVMDLKFYINTKAGYCGNCREDNLFFGDLESHIKGSLSHYRKLPISPKWLPEKKLRRMCSRAITLKNS
jgi:hypothetical protein